MIKYNNNVLPRKLTKNEIALAPIGWRRTLSHYSTFRTKAIRESEPGYYTLIAILSAAIVRHDKHLINVAIELTKNNVPKHAYLTLVGSTLCDFGSKDEGLSMLRETIELHHSPACLLSLAAETDDLEEKEHLAKKVLDENPNDCDALRHLAHAKYFKGECEEAERLIDNILVGEPDNIYALEYKGNIYFDRENYKEALNQYLKIKLKPIPISLQLKICHCYHLLGMSNKAKKIAKRIRGKLSLAYDLELGTGAAESLVAEILNS